MGRPSRILVDVSQFKKKDHGSGIQRVVKNIVANLSHKQGGSYHAIPVCLDKSALLQCENTLTESEMLPVLKHNPVLQVEQQDILLMLDASWAFYDDFSEVFAQVRNQNGKIYTVVYDLIPLLYPHFCNPYLVLIFTRWLHSAVQKSDGMVCISKAVADDLVSYIEQKSVAYNDDLKIGYFHLGADIKAETCKAAVRSRLLDWFDDRRKVFLVVGWLDRRKGQDFALAAFEKLWDAGADVKLIFAGKENYWPEFINRMLTHREYTKRFLWINDPSDAEIIYCYRQAAALLFPSRAEGFGLPLIEAAYYGLPIICSDIPVFREIAREYADYFSLASEHKLAKVLCHWLQQPQHPNSSQMPRLTWEQSAEQLLDVILNNKWCTQL